MQIVSGDNIHTPPRDRNFGEHGHCQRRKSEQQRGGNGYCHY
jgi:hypothetical protein